eukprot:UN02640
MWNYFLVLRLLEFRRRFTSMMFVSIARRKVFY